MIAITIKELITFVDNVKPNVFTNEVKTEWINEVEGKIQTDVFLLNITEIKQYYYTKKLPLHGVTFGDNVMHFVRDADILPGAYLTVKGLLTATENNSDTPRQVIRVEGGDVYFEDGTFTAEDTPETGNADAVADDSGTALLVDAPHDKLYRPYLMAQIDFANADYDKYTNDMALFNAYYGEFVRWFARTYAPANRRAWCNG